MRCLQAVPHSTPPLPRHQLPDMRLLHSTHAMWLCLAQVFYFYNEATGQVQWEDPGHVPYEEQDGRRFWFLPDGSKTFEDPGLGRYAW